MKGKTCCFTTTVLVLGTFVAHLAPAPPAVACGFFYAARATVSKLINKSSKVVLAREGENTVLTLASDYEGDAKEFAMVIAVPTFIEREEISLADGKTIDHLDAYTAPTLAEYRDRDPCLQPRLRHTHGKAAAPGYSPVGQPAASARYEGVSVEASYDVGEYDISILSATQSDGLVNWLTDNEYRIPPGAEAVLGSYIKQGMRFFVAKVNLERMARTGNRFLQPLQMRFRTTKFMLPLRLGTVSANGPQELTIYTLTQIGRVEVTNYRNVKLPTGLDVPLYVKSDFGTFYKAMFDHAVEHENMRAVFVEYVGEAAGRNKQLRELGARWIAGEDDAPYAGPRAARRSPTGELRGPPPPVYVTRLHVRYDAASFPEDLNFLETGDRENFQARFVLHRPWRRAANCPAGQKYREALPARFEKEARNLVALTGWSRQEIDARMEQTDQAVPRDR